MPLFLIFIIFDNRTITHSFILHHSSRPVFFAKILAYNEKSKVVDLHPDLE
jgi:hypothetical protein